MSSIVSLYFGIFLEIILSTHRPELKHKTNLKGLKNINDINTSNSDKYKKIKLYKNNEFYKVLLTSSELNISVFVVSLPNLDAGNDDANFRHNFYNCLHLTQVSNHIFCNTVSDLVLL